MSKTKHLNAFERGQIVVARRMGHFSSKVVQTLSFSLAAVSLVYNKYVNSGKSIPASAKCPGKQCVDELDRRRLVRIVTTDRQATYSQS